MKSNFEILEKHEKGIINRLGGSVTVGVGSAMDEFAKEIAIDFRKWCDENEYANCAALGRSLTNDELYNYYKNNIFPDK